MQVKYIVSYVSEFFLSGNRLSSVLAVSDCDLFCFRTWPPSSTSTTTTT
uniref:Uncharacterized protein n=1 Tax=Anguilla anguilla TaxID=7936 RepID=A0A0E9QRL4_ANGAN